MKLILYFFKKSIWLLLAVICLSTGTSRAQTYANSQTNGVTGLCLLCGVTNPDNAVNNASLDDYSTFSIPLGLLGVTLYQTLIFPAPSSPGCDSLIINIGSGNSILSINLFAGLTVQTFNGSTANNDLRAVDTSNLRLVGNRGEIILKPGNTFDRVKVTLSSSLIGLLSNFRIYYAYRKPSIPTPTAADSTAVCAGSTTTITATGVSGTTIRWYNASTGGSLLSTGNNYSVSPINTTTYYAEASAGGCLSARKAVKVIVNPKPVNPVYTVPDIITCGNTPIIVSNYQSGINYNVRVQYSGLAGLILDTSYVVLNSGNFVVPDINYVTHSQATVWIQAVNAFTGCKSDSVQMSFIYGGHAITPSVSADSVTICKFDSVTLHAFIPNESDVTFRWYDAPFGGNLLFTGENYRVSPPTTTTYYVSAAFACEYPTRRSEKVIVNKLPNPVYTVPQGILCSAGTFIIQNHQSGLNYNVRIKCIPFSRDPLDTSFVVVNKDSIVIPPLYFYVPAQVDIYIQAVNPVTGCKSDSVHKIFTIGGSASLPNVDADSVSICLGDSATLHAYIPNENYALFRWYNAPTGGSLLFTGSYIKVSPGSSIVYYVTAAFECEYPTRRPVIVTVNHCLARATSDSKSEIPTHTQAVKQLNFYPNPTTGDIRFTTTHDIAGSMAIIRTINGREIQRVVLRNNGLKLSDNIPSGIYLIQIITPDNKTYSGKVFLQKN